MDRDHALAVESNFCEQVHWGDHDPFEYMGNVNWGGVMDQRCWTAGWTSVMALLGDFGPPHYCTSICVRSWWIRCACCVDLINKNKTKGEVRGGTSAILNCGHLGPMLPKIPGRAAVKGPQVAVHRIATKPGVCCHFSYFFNLRFRIRKNDSCDAATRRKS